MNVTIIILILVVLYLMLVNNSEGFENDKNILYPSYLPSHSLLDYKDINDENGLHLRFLALYITDEVHLVIY